MEPVRAGIVLTLIFLCYSKNFQKSRAVEFNDPKVQTPLGRIKGSLLTTRLGKPIFSFRGIKYAKPPTGERRFKPSEPINPWTNVYDATQEGPSCPRPNGVNISEDCLILNIYSTKLPKLNNLIKRPVIVFFHPGGYFTYSSQSYIFGPQYLLDQEIVLVTVNYRLASLGFISTGTHHAPGNLGLKDQVIALRFVRDNIASFGGDPNSVTVSGQSAGARSIILHMLSPMSKGLFHRVIALSGSPTTNEPSPHHQKYLAIKQAKVLNCTTANLDDMFECLRGKPAEEFYDSPITLREWGDDPRTIWCPVVEPEIPGLERFLTAQPVEIIMSGNFHQVPVYIGITRDEFGAVVVSSIEAIENGDNSIFVELNQDWYHIAPICFLYQRNTERSKYISRELLKFYFDDEPITLNNSIGLARLYADAIVDAPVHRAVTLFAKYSKEPVYYYKFDYQNRYSFFYWNNGTPYGVSHQDDLIYLFYMSFKFPMFKNSDPEIQMVERMTSMWANFAKTGNPIPKNNSLFKGVNWPPLTLENNAYLNINKDLVMKKNLYQDRMDLWDKLYPPSLYIGLAKKLYDTKMHEIENAAEKLTHFNLIYLMVYFNIIFI